MKAMKTNGIYCFVSDGEGSDFCIGDRIITRDGLPGVICGYICTENDTTVAIRGDQFPNGSLVPLSEVRKAE